MSDALVIGVVADLGGSADDGRRFVRVDRDVVDALPGRFRVSAPIPEALGGGTIAVRSVDDFHPDALIERIAALSTLADRGSGGVPETPRSNAVEAAASPAATPLGGPGLLDAILGGGGPPPGPDPGIDELVRRVTAGHLVPARPAASAAHPALDDALRAVLRAPRFRELEATWRSLRALVCASETGEDLQIFVLDAPRGAAPAALAEELSTPGAPALSLLIAPYRLGGDDLSLGVLAGLATVAEAMAAPVVADVDPLVLGVPDVSALGTGDWAGRLMLPERWRQFRRHALARRVVLCAPRVLTRLPYGAAGDPVARTRFEELGSGGDHEGFLWGSAALAFGSIVSRAFAAEGSGMDLARHADLTGLPVYVPAGGSDPVPCAEVVMSMATIRAVTDQGMTVLASVRDQDRASFWGIGMFDGTPFPALG